MKVQPAAASVLCLCLVLAACAASAAGGLGKGQTNAFFGLSSTCIPTRGGSGPLSPRGPPGGGREGSFGVWRCGGALRGLRRRGSVLAESPLRGSAEPWGSRPPVPSYRVPRACPASAGLLAGNEWPFPPPSASPALRDRSSPRSWLAQAPCLITVSNCPVHAGPELHPRWWLCRRGKSPPQGWL